MKKIFALFSTFSLILLIIIGTSLAIDSEAEFTLYKGWNLVSFSVLDKLENSIDEYGLTVFALNPIDKKYYGGTGNQNVEIEFEKMFETFEDDLIAAQGFWVYSPESKKVIIRSLPTKLEDDFKEKYHLYRGWNLISLYAFVNGKLLDEFKGNCEVEELYGFNNVKQEWSNLDFLIKGEDEFVGLVDSSGNIDDDLGFGYAIKVSSDCNFDFTGSSNVPGVPSLPE